MTDSETLHEWEEIAGTASDRGLLRWCTLCGALDAPIVNDGRARSNLGNPIGPWLPEIQESVGGECY